MKEDHETIKGTYVHRNIGPWPVHIIYRLYGSIPNNVLKRKIEEREHFLQTTNCISTPEEESEWLEQAIEEELHRPDNGPYHLQQNNLSEIIIDSWRWGEQNRNLEVLIVCVMGNHVHALVQSKNNIVVDIGEWMERHKSHTARLCNKQLNTTNQNFWSKGYFDRDLRAGQFSTLMWYILNNPVKAKLVDKWQDWPGIYVHPDYKGDFDQRDKL